MIRYPLELLHEEVAFVSYYLHWDHQTVMDMEHDYRRDWVTQISSINQKVNGN